MEANGMSDIEGKAARVAANERGAVSEFSINRTKRTDRNIQRLNSFLPRLTRRCPTRLSRPCRSSHSLHSSTSLGMTDHKDAADQPSRGLRLCKHGRRYTEAGSVSLTASGTGLSTGAGSMEIISNSPF